MSALSLVQFLNPTAHWYCLFLLVVTLGCLTWLPRSGKWSLETIGFLLATILFFRQLTGVVAGIGVIAFLLFEAHRNGQTRVLAARSVCAVLASGLACYLLMKSNLPGFVLVGVWPLGILIWMAFKVSVGNREAGFILFRLGLGAVVGMMPLVLYHVVNGSLAPWFIDTVSVAVTFTRLSFFDSVDYSMLFGPGLHQVVSLQSLSSVLNGLFWFVMPLLSTALGFLVIRKIVRSQNPNSDVAPLPFVAVFYGVVSLHYQTPIYLFYTVGVTVTALVWMTTAQSPTAKRVCLAMACGLSGIGLYFHAGQPPSRSYGELLSGKRIPLVQSDGLKRCDLWIESADLQLYTHLVDLVEGEVGVDELILAIPVNPELYFLTGRKNPCRFFNSALGIQSDEQLTRVVNDLRRKPPRLVFYRPSDKYNTRYAAELMSFIKRRYELLETFQGVEIYRPAKPLADGTGNSDAVTYTRPQS